MVTHAIKGGTTSLGGTRAGHCNPLDLMQKQKSRGAFLRERIRYTQYDGPHFQRPEQLGRARLQAVTKGVHGFLLLVRFGCPGIVGQLRSSEVEIAVLPRFV